MKNKHQLELLSRYLAFLSMGAKMSGLKEEANRAGAGCQLLQWACGEPNASTEHLDKALQAAKSTFRQLRKEFPAMPHKEVLDMLPGYLMEQEMKQAMPAPATQTRNE